MHKGYKKEILQHCCNNYTHNKDMATMLCNKESSIETYQSTAQTNE